MVEENTKVKVVILAGFTEELVKDKAGVLIQGLSSKLIPVKTIEYLSRDKFVNWSRSKEPAGIEELAWRIFEEISQIDGEVFLVAHSMSGLAVRHAIEVFGLKTKGVIFLAVPHRGCRWKYLPTAFIPCVRQMLPGSKFLKELGEPKGDYWYFVSKKDEKVSHRSAMPVISGKILRGFDSGHNLFGDKEVVKNILTIVGRCI